jgi:hypothetical protein
VKQQQSRAGVGSVMSTARVRVVGLTTTASRCTDTLMSRRGALQCRWIIRYVAMKKTGASRAEVEKAVENEQTNVSRGRAYRGHGFVVIMRQRRTQQKAWPGTSFQVFPLRVPPIYCRCEPPHSAAAIDYRIERRGVIHVGTEAKPMGKPRLSLAPAPALEVERDEVEGRRDRS